MKCTIYKHGEYVDKALTAPTPPVVCPECGEEIKTACVTIESNDNIFVNTRYYRASEICPFCKCKFSAEEKIDSEILWHNCFLLFFFMMIAVGVILMIIGIATSVSWVNITGLVMFFSGCAAMIILGD